MGRGAIIFVDVITLPKFKMLPRSMVVPLDDLGYKTDKIGKVR
jgi:hypothetical protein